MRYILNDNFKNTPIMVLDNTGVILITRNPIQHYKPNLEVMCLLSIQLLVLCFSIIIEVKYSKSIFSMTISFYTVKKSLTFEKNTLYTYKNLATQNGTTVKLFNWIK